MSYARMGVNGSDIYLYEDIDGTWKGWYNRGTFCYSTLEEVWNFICRASKEGAHIPPYVFERVKWEMDNPGQDYDSRTV